MLLCECVRHRAMGPTPRQLGIQGFEPTRSVVGVIRLLRPGGATTTGSCDKRCRERRSWLGRCWKQYKPDRGGYGGPDRPCTHPRASGARRQLSLTVLRLPVGRHERPVAKPGWCSPPPSCALRERRPLHRTGWNRMLQTRYAGMSSKKYRHSLRRRSDAH
eukprot:353783-Chlamydomonas_euryale.AAC.5